MNALTGAFDFGLKITEDEMREQKKFDVILKKIMGICTDPTKKIDVGGTAKLSDQDYIDDNFFNVSNQELRTIENSINNTINGVVEFEGCDNIKLPINLSGTKQILDEVIVAAQGVYTSQKESPMMEYVNVEDLPGGTYNLNICNRWNVLVGSGGVALKSYGPVDIAGSITNLTGEQVNIASNNEVNINAQKRLSISSDILVLRQSQGKQVLVDSNLGITQNIVVAGSAHVEGELTVQHITAPIEFQETEEVFLEGYVLPNVNYHSLTAVGSKL